MSLNNVDLGPVDGFDGSRFVFVDVMGNESTDARNLRFPFHHQRDEYWNRGRLAHVETFYANERDFNIASGKITH